ncbi:alpha/beta hydrolase [Nocardiopsis composta]|uniref:Pimeloyl-ACP methyl ester carboxylesterase n=1 Tax=Nocardiopsis composta TaxID=157465 RepID=A0A7W8QRC6_9ACTN|nr:alpha/beta hydrolase [Nocardiopsis composta]MBB5435064.1 pimeloyl-ACP methyl ester carboxylesterase [Nocardiopsis composta]
MRAIGVPAVALAALLLPVQGVAAAKEQTREDRYSVEWGECTDLGGGSGVQCAELEVPLDGEAGDAPGTRAGETATIALSRVPARKRTEGVLLVNPGGPGSPGRSWASRTAQRLPGDLRDRYDVVGFDPRGTGASTPSVGCDPGYFEPVRPDTVPASGRDEAALVQRAADYAAACADRNGALLEHMRTEDTARDMDRIRLALGAEKIDYLGYSYGTLLGGVYATLFPDGAGRMVLDSVVHPGRPWFESNLEQSRSLDRAAGHFFAWTAEHSAAYGLGTDPAAVEEAYYRVRSELAERPAAGTVGPTEYENSFITLAYTAAAWPPLARALADHVSGTDPEALLKVHERFGESGADDPGYGAYLATECTDAPWPRYWPEWSAAGEKAHADAPFQGWNNIWYNAPCAFWAAGGGPWTEVDGSAAGDALLVHASEDGATPLDGAFAMRGRFPEGRLVVEEGGHTHGVALGGNACVDRAVADYLRDGSLPPAAGGDGADLVCEAGPDPRPEQPGDGGREHQQGPGTLSRS